MKKINKESIILQVIVLIVVFVLAFVIIYGLDFYVDKVTSKYDKEIANSRAELSLGKVLSNKLFIIEDSNIKISNADKLSIVNFYSKKIANSINSFEKILKILQKGGIYEEIVPVNIVEKKQVQEKIEYYNEETSFKIEVIELSQKIVDIKKTSKQLSKKVGIKLTTTETQSIEVLENEVDVLLKQIETYFHRAHESINVIFYNNTIKIENLDSKLNFSKKKLDIFTYIIYILTFVFATFLIRLIFIKIRKLLSEKQNYLNEIKESNETIQKIFDAIPVGVILIDKNKKIAKANKTALKLIKVKNVNDIKSKSCKSIFSIDLEEACPFDNNKCLDEVEIELITNEKEKIPIIKNVIPITINNEVFLLEAFMDVSNQKNIESQLKIAVNKAEESNQLKTEFINNMSHEIRTPMNGILGFSSLLNNENISDEKRKYYISIIQNSGNQLMRIIDDILEISRLGTKQVQAIIEELCLNDLLLEQFSIFDIKAKELKIPLFMKKGLLDKESYILTDKTKLNKILSNLLENALKFTNEGFIEFGYRIIEDKIEIYVKDTGIGIKPKSQKIIFKRFSQEEKQLSKNVGGLGLGLSIAKENAELLDGEITLESEKGKGSTFYITIPYNPTKLDIKKRNSNNLKASIIQKQTKHKILIVEDEEINYFYLETLLENLNLNLEIIHAKHGEEAIQICKENEDVDFILMDLKMPIMNGFDATRHIKKIRPNIPIVAQTAYSTKEKKEDAILAGCNDFISKPISKEALNKIIERYLAISK